MPVSLFYNGHLCWTWDLPLSVVEVLSETPLERTDFFFQLERAWLVVQARVHFF